MKGKRIGYIRISSLDQNYERQLDGFLDNNTILPIKEHTTNTEGYTEHIFALCSLLGIKFMPRIKNLKSQQLYRTNKGIDYGEFNELLSKSVSAI